MIVFVFVLPCTLLFGWMVYRYDLYDKEPVPLLLLSMMLGFLVFMGIGYVEDYSNSRLGFYGTHDNIAGQAAVAATHEELAKLLVVGVMALIFRKHFNDPLDGLIYGAFAGLGMALEESLFYVSLAAYSDLGFASIGPEIVRLVLHILMGGMSGFGVGLLIEHSKIRHWIMTLFVCLAASMSLHFLWDYLCGIPTAMGLTTPEQALTLRISSVLLMTIAMGIFAFAVVLGSRLSRRRFDPDSTARIKGFTLFRRREPIAPMDAGDESAVA